eukprot:gene26175-3553_t
MERYVHVCCGPLLRRAIRETDDAKTRALKETFVPAFAVLA